MSVKPIFFLFVSIFIFCSFCLGQQDAGILNQSERQRIIKRISTLLKNNYVFADTAAHAARYLEKQLQDDKYDGLTHPRALAKVLNADIQKIVKDKHVRLTAVSPEEKNLKRQDPVLAHLMEIRDNSYDNYGIREVKILAQNIGYLNLHSFEAVNLARERVESALHLLSDTDALIIDLRENRGGNPAMVQYICSFFFTDRLHLNSIYWRRGDYIEEFWTLAYIRGKKRPHLPLFILTGPKTFSAAEEMAYNFKTQKRAKLIGARTGGGANPGYSFTISDRFRIFIPTGRAINPVTATNWEGSGVEPDIISPAASAFPKALELAESAARKYREERDNKAVVTIMQLSARIAEAHSVGGKEMVEKYEPLITAELEKCVASGFTGEWAINSLAYNFLSKEKNDIALILLKYNAATYPTSANVYDSLGEVYMKKGEKEKAILHYRKSLEIDPMNENARFMLKKLVSSTE